MKSKIIQGNSARCIRYRWGKKSFWFSNSLYGLLHVILQLVEGILPLRSSWSTHLLMLMVDVELAPCNWKLLREPGAGAQWFFVMIRVLKTDAQRSPQKLDRWRYDYIAFLLWLAPGFLVLTMCKVLDFEWRVFHSTPLGFSWTNMEQPPVPRRLQLKFMTEAAQIWHVKNRRLL